MRFSQQFPSLFDHFFDTDLLNWSNANFSNTNTTLPSVNIKEDKDGFTVEMAAHGLEKNDFRIELNHQVLSIYSEKKTEKESTTDEKFTRREFSYPSFQRSFTLPNSIDSEKIEAKYENGILRVVIPKREEAKPRPPKQIAIE